MTTDLPVQPGHQPATPGDDDAVEGEVFKPESSDSTRCRVLVDWVVVWRGPAWKSEEAADLARSQYPEAEVVVEEGT